MVSQELDPLVVQLRAARLAAGMLQRQVAERVQVQPKMVGRWELGRASPRLVHLHPWAHGLGLLLALDGVGVSAGPEWLLAALDRLRRERGMTMQELATRAGTTQSRVSALAAGLNSPRLVTMRRLAAAVGTAPVLMPKR